MPQACEHILAAMEDITGRIGDNWWTRGLVLGHEDLDIMTLQHFSKKTNNKQTNKPKTTLLVYVLYAGINVFTGGSGSRGRMSPGF